MDLTKRYSNLSDAAKRMLLAHGIGLSLFLLIQMLPIVSPEIRIRVFSEPAARIAAVFLGTPLRIEGEAISLDHPAINVAITEACSGFDFYCLLSALLIGLVVFKRGPRRSLRDLLFILLAAYGLTLLGNTSRIICAIQIRIGTDKILPSSFDAIIHQSIGVIIFVTILLVTWNFLTNFYDRKQLN